MAVKGISGGTSLPRPGGTRCDIEVRYTLGRGESGIYAYAIFSHPAAYPAMGVGESRYITKLNHAFDWISVDADRNMLECSPQDWGAGIVVHAKEQRILTTGVYKNSVEHKYSYNAVQYKIPAYGWSSTKHHVGIWFINPTIEYLSGGASKQELVCHFDANNNPDPIILDYWRGTHYGGGASCNIAAGEQWSKVIGPIFVYCNALADPRIPSRPTSPRWRPPPATLPCRRPGRKTPRFSGTTRSTRPRPRRPAGPTIGSTAWTTRTKQSAAASPASSCSTIRRQPRPGCPT